MIFCTLGTQLPFDRLLKFVDEASLLLPEEKFFAQIAESEYKPKNIEWCNDLSEKEYHAVLGKSKLIISHAGMGTIINALDYSIPLIMLPRKFSLGEHRNDHQLATASRFGSLANVTILEDNQNLTELILKVINAKDSDATLSVENESIKQFAKKIDEVINP